MELEGLDGSLSSIAAINIGRDKLVLCLPCVFNGGFEFGADLIIKDLEVDSVAMIG